MVWPRFAKVFIRRKTEQDRNSSPAGFRRSRKWRDHGSGIMFQKKSTVFWASTAGFGEPALCPLFGHARRLKTAPSRTHVPTISSDTSAKVRLSRNRQLLDADAADFLHPGYGRDAGYHGAEDDGAITILII